MLWMMLFAVLNGLYFSLTYHPKCIFESLGPPTSLPLSSPPCPTSSLSRQQQRLVFHSSESKVPRMDIDVQTIPPLQSSRKSIPAMCGRSLPYYRPLRNHHVDPLHDVAVSVQDLHVFALLFRRQRRCWFPQLPLEPEFRPPG